MVNVKLPFSSVKEILEACSYSWKADVSSGETTDTDKHIIALSDTSEGIFTSQLWCVTWS